MAIDSIDIDFSPNEFIMVETLAIFLHFFLISYRPIKLASLSSRS